MSGYTISVLRSAKKLTSPMKTTLPTGLFLVSFQIPGFRSFRCNGISFNDNLITLALGCLSNMPGRDRDRSVTLTVCDRYPGGFVTVDDRGLTVTGVRLLTVTGDRGQATHGTLSRSVLSSDHPVCSLSPPDRDAGLESVCEQQFSSLDNL